MDAEPAVADSTQVLNPEDVFIAVMGLTGSGKSTFATLCTQKEIQIGHSLESCTSSVSIFSFQHKSKTVHLIDTPGFNDTTRSESEVLQEVAYWLSSAYGKADAKQENRFLLDGIVYLHSIADVRWSGSTRRSLNMLCSIVGKANYDAIVLTTTFWDQVDRETGKAREAQLIGDMNKWGQLVHTSAKSSTVRRHDQGYKTAINIVDAIMDRGVKYELLIQKELAKPGATLHDTTAGREAQILWEQDIERFQQDLGYAREALSETERKSDATLETEMTKLKTLIGQGRTALSELHLPKKELENRWVSRNSRDVGLLQRKIAECQATITSLMKPSTAASTTLSSSESPPPAYSPPTSSSSDSLLRLDQERIRKKELLAQQMAKMAARSMHVNVASALFGGVSAGIAILPLLPYLASCCVM